MQRPAELLTQGLVRAAALIRDARGVAVVGEGLQRSFASWPHQDVGAGAAQARWQRAPAAADLPAAPALLPGRTTALGWNSSVGSGILHPAPFQALGGGQRRGMFIQTQPTPNPHSLMFLPGQQVMESGSHEFSSARAGMASPLAKRLFQVDGVTSVFFGADFITVTKQEEANWAVIKPHVFEAVMDHWGSGAPLFYDNAAQAADVAAIHEDDDEVVAMIKELLETRIRPAVQEDGGDITFRSFDPDTGTVMVKMMGACSGCPSSSVTLKSGIENMLMHYIPEVKHVMEAGPDEGENEALKEFEKFEASLSERG